MSFKEAMKFVARWEGGKVNNPLDPGGKTAYGITQRVYDHYRRTANLPAADVFKIDKKEVDDIYYNQYWLAARCQDLPEPLDLVVFDTAVNMGVGRAIRFLQQSLGIETDGHFGPITMRSVLLNDAKDVAAKYVTIRKAFYVRIVELRPSQQVFAKGWNNRVTDLETQFA